MARSACASAMSNRAPLAKRSRMMPPSDLTMSKIALTSLSDILQLALCRMPPLLSTPTAVNVTFMIFCAVRQNWKSRRCKSRSADKVMLSSSSAASRKLSAGKLSAAYTWEVIKSDASGSTASACCSPVDLSSNTGDSALFIDKACV